MLALKILIEFNASPETLDEPVQELVELFPHSLFIRSQKAMLAYHHRGKLFSRKLIRPTNTW